MMVCHGNICRSPMAATLMRVMAEAAGWDDALWVDSCGVSDEEEGNPMDRRTKAKLLSHGIRPAPHEARRFSRGDYAMYDDILCMEERNRRGLLRLLGGDPEGKLRLLLENTSLVVTRETILQVVWGTDISVESRTVDMHIRTLRKKLGDAGKYVCSVRKVGYKLTDEEEAGEE